ncbi:MAG: hypothetical protein MUF78_08085 [Candidatus Edwardsbacteria bacterium]|jgi:tetratricopeptide (TPR) repeat protein|nr:hypothetical protein [Candidatus Edwardsbacteria bacterium]
MKRTPYNSLTAICCGALFAASAFAVPGLNVWPSKVEVSAAAGAVKTGVLAVQNQGVSTRTLRVLVVNCRMNRDGSLSYVEEDDPRGCRQWIKASAREITINPRANHQLLYSVKLPRDAAGSYIAALLLADAARQDLASGDYRDLPGAIMLVTVPNSGARAADLAGLSLRRSDGEGYVAELLVRNRGTLALTPSGLVQVYGDDGAEKQRLTLNQGRELVLPGATRSLDVPIERLEAGSYKMTATVDYGSLELLQGETTVYVKGGEVLHQQGGEKRIDETGPDRQQPAKANAPAAGAKKGKASQEDIAELMRLGTSLYSSGDYAKALGVWQRVLKADPRNAAAKKNLERTRQKLKALKGAKG